MPPYDQRRSGDGGGEDPLFLKKHSVREAGKLAGVHYSQVAYALTILEYAPELADSVIAGATPLNEAYADAQKRKEAKQSDEFKIARLRRLPEFANQAHTPFER